MSNRPKYVYVLIDNWSTDYSTKVFSTKKNAIKSFKCIVMEHCRCDIDSDNQDVNNTVRKAVKDMFFEYNGNGEEDITPHVQIIKEKLN